MSNEVQKDLVLSINEYAYVLDRTKGNVSCWVGPVKTSLSTSDQLVVFDEQNKRFVEARNHYEAIKLFATAPENWYIVLKNPVLDSDTAPHPNKGCCNDLPSSIQIGKKINVTGPVSFALYPGQMCKVVQGHSLRSNQYLLAKVYDAHSASMNASKALNSEGKEVDLKKDYVTGQFLVIKGTEVSFYIPPTGIEVIYDTAANSYVRNAVTLERLEYCILKDEDGNKRYVHGPNVVFPEPTEVFIESSRKSIIFRATELSLISGIYVKVIAEYEEKGVKHPVGEELFITGKDQMIYYPRPEHAIISYDNKIMHHAIAIPEGEGRYIMNRLTGEIQTILGPKMYLTDPRTEVVIKRKLSEHQCELWFPDNVEALAYNRELNEASVEREGKGKGNGRGKGLNYSTANADVTSMGLLDSSVSISRGTSYTKPRTVTLDTKYDGAVGISVWNGYAVKAIKKTGESRIVVGPSTILLDYDETLESFVDDNGNEAVYLPLKSSFRRSGYRFKTVDNIDTSISCYFQYEFDPDKKDKWFMYNDWYKVILDKIYSELTIKIKATPFETVYATLDSIVKDTCVDVPFENGVSIKGINTSITAESKIQSTIDQLGKELLQSKMEVDAENQRLNYEGDLLLLRSELVDLKREKAQEEANLDMINELEHLRKMEEIEEIRREQRRTAFELDAEFERARIELHKEKSAAEISKQEELNRLKIEMEKNSAERLQAILSAISPSLVAALTSKSNENMLSTVAKAMSPYAIAGDTSIAETVNTLMRGTTLENIFERVIPEERDTSKIN